MSSLRTFLNTPLAVGSRTVDARVVLAPMAGLGHVAMRQVIAGFGLPGFLSMEMCNARAVPGENRHTSAVFRWQDSETGRLVCQIFGGDPQVMALAAARIESEGLFGVDINMGCSVSAICSKGYGAALLRDPERASGHCEGCSSGSALSGYGQISYRLGKFIYLGYRAGQAF